VTNRLVLLVLLLWAGISLWVEDKCRVEIEAFLLKTGERADIRPVTAMLWEAFPSPRATAIILKVAQAVHFQMTVLT
jgi:hypothetical protein